MGIKRILCVAVIIISAPLFAQFCDPGSMLIQNLSNVEDPTNLFQYATPCRIYLLNASNIILQMQEDYPVYSPETHSFGFTTTMLEKINYGGTCPASGTQAVAVCDYVTNAGELTQVAYYAASIITINTTVPEGQAVAFVEVPHLSITKPNPPAVHVAWSAVPVNSAVAGYRLCRSPDGITNWATVTDTTNTYADDNPGAGTWYYALQIIYAGSPSTYVSYHGLLATVTIEE